MLGKRAARAGLGGLLLLFAPAVQAEPVCTQPKTTCGGADGYYASLDDVNRLVAVSEPVLKDLRACLDAAGGKHITPNVTIRWDSGGKAVSVKIDVPGYDTLPCVAKITAKLSTLQNPHETAIRCDYGCAKAAPPPPSPPVAPSSSSPSSSIPPPGVVVMQPQPQPQLQPQLQPYPPPPPPSAPPPYAGPPLEREWYGWQGLVFDAAAIGIFVGGWAVDDGTIVGAGWFTYVLGAPITHWAHGNVGRGFGDIGMRVGIPVAGFLVGGLFGFGAGVGGNGKFKDLGPHSNGPVVGAVVGGAIATVAMSALDAFVFAYTKPRPAEQASWLTWQPTLDLRPGRGTAGVGGTF